MPDAVLLNGAGQEDCNLAQGDADCDFNTPSETRARMGSKLRLRLINHGSLCKLLAVAALTRSPTPFLD